MLNEEPDAFHPLARQFARRLVIKISFKQQCVVELFKKKNYTKKSCN
jgi:hypothetical protein